AAPGTPRLTCSTRKDAWSAFRTRCLPCSREPRDAWTSTPPRSFPVSRVLRIEHEPSRPYRERGCSRPRPARQLPRGVAMTTEDKPAKPVRPAVDRKARLAAPPNRPGKQAPEARIENWDEV